MGRDRGIITQSAEETMQFGIEFGKSLEPNSVVCLLGDLGAGKTTLAKGVVEGITGISHEKVNSPTFVYLNVYDKCYHFDLYRLHDADEFLSLGFDEYFYAGGVCCIEWSERIASILPENAVSITMSHIDENSREIKVELSKRQIS